MMTRTQPHVGTVKGKTGQWSVPLSETRSVATGTALLHSTSIPTAHCRMTANGIRSKSDKDPVDLYGRINRAPDNVC